MLANFLMAAVLIIQAQTVDRTIAADWTCAAPLIARNYQRTMPLADRFVLAPDLAERIADQCARPYTPRPLVTDADRFFESNERTLYAYDRIAFRREILDRIDEAKRRQTIPLD